MTKAFIRYFLPLCVLLLSGYGQLSARPHQELTSSLVSSLRSDTTAITAVSGNHLWLSKSSSSDTSRQVIVDNAQIVEKEEDDESVSSKKYVERSHYFTTLFYAYLSEHFGHFVKKRLSYYQRFVYSSPFEPLYLALRVIRI